MTLTDKTPIPWMPCTPGLRGSDTDRAASIKVAGSRRPQPSSASHRWRVWTVSPRAETLPHCCAVSVSAGILARRRCSVNPSQITTIKHAHEAQCLSNPMESKAGGVESHPKALKASSHLGLHTGCSEPLVSGPKTAQGSISVSPGVTPGSGREPQGEALEDRMFRKCRARVGSHRLDDWTPSPPGRPPRASALPASVCMS